MTDFASKTTFDPADAGWVRHEDSGFIDHIGPLWEREADERLLMAFLAEAKHHNRNGVVQGGMLMAFADRAMGMSSRRATGGLPQATVQFEMQFIDAVQIGEFVVLEAELLRRTRSLVFLRGTLKVGDRVVASSTGVWKVLGA